MRRYTYPANDPRIQHIMVLFHENDVFSGETLGWSRTIILFQQRTLIAYACIPIPGTIIKYVGDLHDDKFIYGSVSHMWDVHQFPLSNGQIHCKLLSSLSPRLLDLMENCIFSYLTAKRV